MSGTVFPTQIDSDLELPPVVDNIVEIGAEAIQAIRSAMFAVETEIGIGASGTMGSITDRLNVSLNDDGTIKNSAIVGLGLVVLPIFDSEISPTAAIQESKIALTYTTQFLYDSFNILNNEVDVLNDFVSTSGAKIEPHIAGAGFRHLLSHIDVDSGVLSRVNISDGSVLPRDLTNAYTFAAEFSNDFLDHVQADKINNDTAPPANQAHNAAGIYINPTYFISVPQTANDLQTFAEYVDSSSLALLGSRTQNLYSNGIPRSSRANSLVNDEAGPAIVDPTPATTYLLYSAANSPVDHIEHGDNIILLNPNAGVLANNTFDAQFSQVKPGDYITINYGEDIVPVTFTVDSAKKFLNGSSRIYTIRINGKNLLASASAIVRIDRPFYRDSNYNPLAIAEAHNAFSETPSLIIGSARGASALGINFDASLLDSNHYNLYLALYPTGNPVQKTLFLPAIDITGNAGLTPGKYTLSDVVSNFNNKVRVAGFNYRFIAFAYQGQFGISLADHYNDVSFSIISGVVNSGGNYTSTSNASYPANVVDNYDGYDPLGIAFSGSNVASPPFSTSYAAPLSALNAPTLILSPTRRNFFYVDGVEKDNFALEEDVARDGYGDGYWLATLVTRTVLSGHVEAVYDIELDLSTSGLKIGKTLVVQPAVSFDSASYDDVDYGRFIISNVVFTNCPGPTPITTITVYDAIHGTGTSPIASSVSLPVKIYFTDDSVSFDKEQVSDVTISQTFRRFFETYINTTGKTFTHERARFNITGTDVVVDSVNGFTLYSDIELYQLNIVDVSPKLRGYGFGQYTKITLRVYNYDTTTGIFTANLSKFTFPSTYAHQGPIITGKKGEIVRLYDETNIDYIDITFDVDETISTFLDKQIDIELFGSLELNQEKLLLAKCQLSDTTGLISYIKDARQFGNVSEKQLSTSALNYIAAPQRLLSENGIVRGFEVISTTGRQIKFTGGTALIDGKIININESEINMPVLREALSPTFSTTVNLIKWFLCANSKGNLELIASTDYEISAAATYGSLDHNRIFYVKNPAASTTYAVRSAYLQKLLLEMKDLVPLYIVTTTANVAGTTITIGTADIRRYVDVGNQGIGTYFSLGLNSTFRSLASLNNTLAELVNKISFNLDERNVFGSTVYVRDNFNVSGVQFNYITPIKFIGDGGSFSASSAYAAIGYNVEFRDLTLNVSNSIGFNLFSSNIIFDNCIFNYSYDATSDGSFTAANLGNIGKACILANSGGALDAAGIGNRSNIQIKNCKFLSNIVNRFPFISLFLDSESDYFENIIISNNIIQTLTASSTDDKRAAIMISHDTNASASTTLGPRLVNCQINNNICNKNQMILISSESNGSSLIANMIVPVNVIIDKNICGAICYLTRQDRANNTVNTNRINDKDNMISITNNTCRYIFCGTNKGFINVVGSSNRVINSIITGLNVYSSSATIKDNVCSWIHIGVKNPTTFAFEVPSIIVEDNRLTAFNSSFLNDYHSVISPTNIGLIIDSINAGT